MKKEIICFDIKGEGHKFEIKDLSFRISVYAVIVKEGKVLLLRQWEDKYNFPGGGVNLGESTENALKREILEETNLKFKSSKIIHQSETFFLVPFEEIPVHSVILFFACKLEDGIISTKNFDEFEKKYSNKAEWVDFEEAKKLEYILPGAKEVLNSGLREIS